MSWLEYLGLEYLLSDKDLGGEVSLGGIAAGIGGLCWFLLLIFQPALVDKGAVTFNLLIAVGLFVLTIIKYIRNLQFNKEKSIARLVFYIISAITIIISFVYGLNKTYHSLLFDYDYKGIYSAIASTLYPMIVLNLLFPFFCEKNTFGSKIQEGFETIGLTLILIVVFFFIGQIVTLGVSFSDNTKFYDSFITYHDMDITKYRQNWEYKSVEECINTLLPKGAQDLVNNTKEQTEKAIINNIHENYPSANLKTNGIVFSNKKWESDYIVTYVMKDKEFNKLYYVRFNYQDYSILGYVDKAYYDNIKVEK